jgi:hypothetical protein
MKNSLLMGAAILAVLSALAHFNAKPLLAQIRAALVKNIDEPGRSPYQSVSHGTPGTPTFCVTEFAPIPPNKRLVVEHLSAYAVLTGGTSASAVIEGKFSAPNLVNGPEVFFTATSVPDQRWAANQQMTVYVEPGGVPRVELSIPLFTFGPRCTAHGTLSGHLIDLTQ